MITQEKLLSLFKGKKKIFQIKTFNGALGGTN